VEHLILLLLLTSSSSESGVSRIRMSLVFWVVEIVPFDLLFFHLLDYLILIGNPSLGGNDINSREGPKGVSIRLLQLTYAAAGIRGIRGYSITGNTQSLHLCIGSSNLPTSITSMTLANIDRVLGKDHLSQRVRSILFYLSLTCCSLRMQLQALQQCQNKSRSLVVAFYNCTRSKPSTRIVV